MTAFSALIPTDLSRIDLLRNGTPGEHWIAPPGQGETLDADALRRRVTESSLWCARHCGGRKLTAILDVEEAACRWVHAPSSAAPVVAAALKSQGEEWASVAPVGGVEPLANGAESNGSAKSLVAITMPDALARLWLDGLDRHGTRVTNVATLWHASVAAWGNAPPDTLQAIVLVDDVKRLVWAWCEGDKLITAGQVRLNAPTAQSNSDRAGATEYAGAAAARLALDWAAWSAQLGRTPGSVRLIGADAIPDLETALRRRLVGATIDTVEERDAIVATLRKASEVAAMSPSQPDAAHCLARLASRPGRSLRWRYRIWGAALLVLGAGLAIGGVRMWSMANTWHTQAQAARAELGQRIQRDFEGEYQPQPGINPLGWLRQTLAQASAASNTELLPPEPRPIFETTSTLLEQIALAKGKPKLTKLRLSQADGDNYLQLEGIDRSDTYSFMEQLRTAGTPLAWTAANTGRNNQNARINGQWETP